MHWTVAVLMLTCIATAAILYNGSLAVPRRAPPARRADPRLLRLRATGADPARRRLGAYRADLRRLNRFTPGRLALAALATRRDGSIQVGKFNAGQKLNAALSAGAIFVTAGHRHLMYFPGLVRLSWRTGATFVHDWFALALGLLVIGHIAYAMRDREALRGMRTGQVST